MKTDEVWQEVSFRIVQKYMEEVERERRSAYYAAEVEYTDEQAAADAAYMDRVEAEAQLHAERLLEWSAYRE